MHSIHVDPAQRLGLVVLHGEVRGTDLVAADEELYSQKAWQMDFDECWDCRGVGDLSIVLDELRMLVELETGADEPVPTGRVVVIVASEEAEIIARLYAAMIGDAREVHVVDSVAAAQTILAPKRLEFNRIVA